ncbi:MULTISPECIES: sugar kinase [Arhodomonas]|uniref:sugar kinase n=1 Tax=Arhodomonas TaxID=2368 RepID=UPI00037E8CB0|nr:MULTISPECIES: sugar kinase [Arhodomonas]
MVDIVCLGEPLLELSERPGDGGTWFLQGYGGDTSNCAIAAARQEAAVGYLTALGDDGFGRAFLDLWAAEGVDASAVAVDRDAHTGVYFIRYRDGEHVFSYLRQGSAASRLGPDDLPLDYIRAARVLHVSGISQAISSKACDAVFAAMAAAREAGVTVSYDTNLRLKLWPLARARAVIHAAMREADIALPGLEDARRLTGLTDPDAVVDFYAGLGPRVVALKMGREGVLVAADGERVHCPAHPVAQVDAAGAGDAFDGAFLAGIVRGARPEAAARYANVAAALSTLGRGAVAPIPRRAAVEAALDGA